MCNESAAQAAYRRSRKRRRRAIAAAQWGILIVLLAAWEILARTGVLDAFLLSLSLIHISRRQDGLLPFCRILCGSFCR